MPTLHSLEFDAGRACSAPLTFTWTVETGKSKEAFDHKAGIENNGVFCAILKL